MDMLHRCADPSRRCVVIWVDCKLQAGDTVVVHMLNRLTYPVNLLAAGLNTSVTDANQVAAPTEMLTWTWTVPLDVSPDHQLLLAPPSPRHLGARSAPLHTLVSRLTQKTAIV